MKKNLIKIGVLGMFLVPAIAFAQDALSKFKELINTFGDIINLLLPIVFALAILAFFYGIMLYVFSQSSENKKEGRGIMLWALVAIFVMASLWGIINFAQTTLGISTDVQPFEVPSVR